MSERLISIASSTRRREYYHDQDANSRTSQRYPHHLSLINPQDGARGPGDSTNSHPSLSSSSSALSFPITVSEAQHLQHNRHGRPRDIQLLLKTASNCYSALDFNQMILVLQNIKLKPDSDSQRDYMAVEFGLALGMYKLSFYDFATSHLLNVESVAKKEKDDGNICLTSYYLGEVEYSQNKFTSSAEYYEIAIMKYDTNGVGLVYNVTVPSLSALFCKRGTMMRYASKIMEAVKLYKKGVELAKSSRDLDDRLSAHTCLGNLYQSLGDYSKSVEEYKETIQLAEELKDYISLGWAHGNIGNGYLGLCKKSEALNHLEKALNYTLVHEPVPQAIGRAYNNLGTAYQSLSHLDRARDYYEQALFQAIYGNDRPGQARVYGNLGNLLMLKNLYSDAISYYTETLSISRDRATQITAYHNRGCARYELAEEERKKYLLENSTVVSKSSLIYTGPDVNDTEDEHKFVILPDHLLKYYRDSKSDLERVVKHHEQTLQDIKGSQRGLSLSVSLFETNARTFQRLQDCAFFINDWKLALVYAEQCRARTLGELLLVKHSKNIPVSFHTPIDLPQMTSIVQNQKLPVIYVTYTGSRLLVWVLTPLKDEVSINFYQVALNPNQFQDKSFDYLTRVQLNESLIESKIDMYEECDYTISTLLNDLYELIAKPLLKVFKCIFSPEHHLSKLSDVIIIPDSYTKLIPMAALQDPLTREFLGDKLRFHCMSSLLTMGIVNQLPLLVVDALSNSDTCIVGNPHIPVFTYQNRSWNLGRLPFAEQEAQRVAFKLRVEPILGNEALKDVILSKLSSAKVVHMATHGSASNGFLVLAGSNALSESDEQFSKSVLLFPEDIEKITTRAVLVVLSSCDSGRGAVKADGIQGIARSFLLAGAQAVLTSLWRVPDESASSFMYYFYQYLVDGIPSFKALQKTALSIRCYAKYSSYIHWSGYQLQGRDVQFKLGNRTSDESIRGRIGIVNTFPRLAEVLKVKKELMLKSKSHSSGESNREKDSIDWFPDRSHRTDVQFFTGSLATRPQEIATDFIFSAYAHYTGGIFWIPCHSSDLTFASITHIEKLLGIINKSSSSNFAEFISHSSQPILIVMDEFQSLSNSSLINVLRKTNVHIIITSHISIEPSTIAEEIHKVLNRGTSTQEIKPLQLLSSMQRLVYSIMKKHDLTPMNEDQRIIGCIDSYTCGNPALIDITVAILLDCIDKCNGDCSTGLKLFDEKVIELTRIYLNEAISKDEMNTAARRKHFPEQELFVPNTNIKVIPSQTNEPSGAILQDLNKHENLAIIYTQVLLQFLSFTHLEYVFLCSLSILHSAPIHSSFINSLEKTLKNFCSKEIIDFDLQNKLKTNKILVVYPHPVIKAPESIADGSDTNQYYMIPPVICEALQPSMTKEDKIVFTSLIYHTLKEATPRTAADVTPQTADDDDDDLHASFISLHYIGLCHILLQQVSNEYVLFGKDVFRDIVEKYINDKIDIRTDEGLAEIMTDIDINL